MKTPEDFIPAHIRSLGAYVPGKPVRDAERESGVKAIKMASNENPFGPSPLAIEAMRRVVENVHIYPDNDASTLKHDLARRHDLRPEQVLIGGGSTPILDMVARTLLGPGTNAITSERSFIVYPIVTRATGATLIEIPTRNDGYDLDAIAAAVDENTRVIYLANPNNPTGTVVDADATDRFLAKIPESVMVVLDEAYTDFANAFARERGITYSRSLEYVRSGRKNLLVVRTFSKAHGLAAVRVGFVFGPAEYLQFMARVRLAFTISSPAEAAALAAIGDQAHIARTVENNTLGAHFLEENLRNLGFRVVPTFANFVYFEAANAPDLVKQLQNEGIIVRGLGPWGIPGAIRVTVGTPEQNERFVSALLRVVHTAGAK